MALISLLVSAIQVASLVGEYPDASDRLMKLAPTLSARPNLDLRGYEVRGTTFRQLAAEIAANGPVSEGRRFAGFTDGRVDYSFNVGACRPDQTEVTAHVAVVLPHLVNPGALSRTDRAHWERYFEILTAHELNHVRLIEAGRDRIASAMHAAPDCQAAIAAGGAINAEIAEQHVEYDRRTDHGTKEGPGR